jgi:60 kDa SS-A/Ro ribonucleoprotein
MSLSTARKAMNLAESVHLTGQQKLLPGMQRNNAGGGCFVVDDKQRVLRYLILGTEKGTYYVSPVEHSADNYESLLRLMETGQGVDAVKIIEEVSVSGRASKQTPTMTALAICCILGDKETKTAANKAVQKVCRIPTHFFEWIDKCEQVARTMKDDKSTGWGKAHRKAVHNWYHNHKGGSAKALAYSVSKYPKRGGWSHLDCLRLSHSIPSTSGHAVVYAYIVKGLDKAKEIANSDSSDVVNFLTAVEEVKEMGKPGVTNIDSLIPRVIELIREHGLVREHLPTIFLNSISIWTTLLENMPIGALIRSLSKLTSIGVISEKTLETQIIVERLNNQELLHKGRIHPIAVLQAERNYRSGRGEKGSLTWKPVNAVSDALDKAFELSFASVVPANKRFLLGIDVSGSMTWGNVCGGSLNPHEASAAMAVVTMRTEPQCTAMMFSDTFTPLPITKETSLEDAIRCTQHSSFGATDCALPMTYAMEKNMEVDVFVVYTDSETYYGNVHPCEALRRYRSRMGIPDAKLIVVGMVSNGFTIADPSDPGMLDVVGFDSSAPSAMSNFAAGNL